MDLLNKVDVSVQNGNLRVASLGGQCNIRSITTNTNKNIIIKKLLTVSHRQIISSKSINKKVYQVPFIIDNEEVTTAFIVPSSGEDMVNKPLIWTGVLTLIQGRMIQTKVIKNNENACIQRAIYRGSTQVEPLNRINQGVIKNSINLDKGGGYSVCYTYEAEKTKANFEISLTLPQI